MTALCPLLLLSPSVPNLAGYLKDSNASSQDAATKLCCSFFSRVQAVKGGGFLNEHVSSITGVLVDKGFGGRPSTKKTSMDCIVEIAGAGASDEAMVSSPPMPSFVLVCVGSRFRNTV